MKNKKKRRRKRRKRRRKKKSMRIGGKSVKRERDTSYAPLIYITFGVSVVIFLSAIAGIVVSSIFINKTDNIAWLWMLFPSIIIVIVSAVCCCISLFGPLGRGVSI